MRRVCRCQKAFCGKHIHDHECTFDWKAFGKEESKGGLNPNKRKWEWYSQYRGSDKAY